eukprot:2922029-Rhodomonas_salina.1
MASPPSHSPPPLPPPRQKLVREEVRDRVCVCSLFVTASKTACLKLGTTSCCRPPPRLARALSSPMTSRAPAPTLDPRLAEPPADGVCVLGAREGDSERKSEENRGRGRGRGREGKHKARNKTEREQT